MYSVWTFAYFLVFGAKLTLAFSPRIENIEERIVGGEEAASGQFPFAAAISITTNTSQFFCGGALLSNQFILTSAQCVLDAINFTIILGSTSLTEENPNRVVVATSEYFVHPGYIPNSSSFDNDIGLIRLRSPIEFNDYIGQIYLPVTEYSSGVPVTALGWGQTSDVTVGPIDHLQCVNLATISNAECKVYYGDYIGDHMICAAGNYDEGTCTGDSGTPLVYFLNLRHPIHVAVSTFISFKGCENAEPSGYIRTFPYRDWILNITDNLDLS